MNDDAFQLELNEQVTELFLSSENMSNHGVNPSNRAMLLD